MTAWHNILGVARYERKMLLRTTKFRLLGGVGLLIPVLIGGGLAVAEARGLEFNISGLGAFMPFYVYSFLQTIVIAFIVGDFRAADERANIYEVVAARPISTAELVTGKYLGVVGALVSLSLGILILTLTIQAAKISVTGTPFNLAPYLGYLLLMNLPGLIYMSAVTFFLGALLRRQTAVALVVIAYALVVLFFLGRKYNGIYDFGAFFEPLYFSDLIGLGDTDRLIALRLFYLSLALGFFGLSIDRYPRLPQSVAWSWFGRGAAIVGLVGAVGIYFSLDAQQASQLAYREDLLHLQETYANRAVPDITHYDMKVDFVNKDPLKAEVNFNIKNSRDLTLDTLIVSLNPGLNIISLQYGDESQTRWTRVENIIKVVPQTPLPPLGESKLLIAYAGDIDRNGFDLMRDEGKPRLRKREGPVTKGSLTAWIRDRAVFLPPRSRWYPVMGVDYGYENGRQESFATANIAVTSKRGLEVITQGQCTQRDTVGNREIFVWKVTKPTPYFSLNIGEYAVYSAQIHGVDCALYMHPSHTNQVTFFDDSKDEIIQALDQLFDSMTQETGLAYPYAQMSIVEVPFHVQWYYEGWEETGGLTQPGVLMVEEDMILRQRFNRNFNRLMSSNQGNREPKDIKKNLFVQGVFDLFFSNENANGGLYRSPVVQLWTFDKNFGGENYGLMKTGLPMYLQDNLSTEMRTSFYSRGRGGRGGFGGGGFGNRSNSGSGVAWDTLVTKMQQRSFSDLKPNEEAELYRSVLQAKGSSLFKMVEAYVGDNAFLSTLETIDQEHQFDQVDFASFERAAVGDTTENSEQKNLQRLMHEWLYGTEVPGYTLTRVVANKVDDGFGMVMYQLIVRIRNGEPGRGFVQIRASGRGDEATKGVEIEGGQEVEVAMVLWERPFVVTVEPFFARNRRALRSPIRIPEDVKSGMPETYVREVSESDQTYVEIVVDNDDEGFDMPIRRDRRFLRPELKGGNWDERTLPMAFGRYETNYRQKSPGDGAQPAIWSARMPHGGEYDVAYYFLDANMAKRMKIASKFQLYILHNGITDTLAMDRNQLKAGWNVLGRYRLEAGEVTWVELPDLGDGRLYADAVRWRYVDPNRPNDNDEEDLPTWQMFGGRQGGGQRGGGNWGGRGGQE